MKYDNNNYSEFSLFIKDNLIPDSIIDNFFENSIVCCEQDKIKYFTDQFGSSYFDVRVLKKSLTITLTGYTDINLYDFIE